MFSASHDHERFASSITTVAYSSTEHGTTNGTDIPLSAQITAIEVQTALEDITDNKAAKTPTYGAIGNAPIASTVEGMVAYASSLPYVSNGTSWVRLIKEDDSIWLPYDFSFFITGGMQTDTLVSSFVITRDITILTGAPDAVAYADQTATDGTYTLDIVKRDSTSAFSSTVVGTVAFSVATPAGVFVWGADTSFVSSDLLQIRTPAGTPDPGLEDISITLVGRALSTIA